MPIEFDCLTTKIDIVAPAAARGSKTKMLVVDVLALDAEIKKSCGETLHHRGTCTHIYSRFGEFGFI